MADALEITRFLYRLEHFNKMEIAKTFCNSERFHRMRNIMKFHEDDVKPRDYYITDSNPGGELSDPNRITYFKIFNRKDSIVRYKFYEPLTS